MQKKTLYIIPLFLILLTFLLVKCKKEENYLFNSNFSSISSNYPIFSSHYEVINQLQWIARGYAEALHLNDPLLLDFIHDYLSLKDEYLEAQITLEGHIQQNLGLDLEMEVYNAVNNLPFHTNQYNRDVFHGFNLDSCDHVTTLAIVDTNDRSLPLRITYYNFEESDEVWGYYWNNNSLDSTLLTESNFEDYYILLVNGTPTCDISKYKNGMGCNNNCICEPLQGETAENCYDCKPRPNDSCPDPPSLTAKNLKIVEVQINFDNQTKDEAWIQNRYNLGWGWAIAEGTDGKITHYRPDQDFDIFNHWKRKQLPWIVGRKRTGSLTKKTRLDQGVVTIYTEYEPTLDDIYFFFYEDDRYGSKSFEPIKTIPGNNIINFHPSFDDRWAKRLQGGSFDKGGSSPFGGIFKISANSSWTSGMVDNEPHSILTVTNPSGEITIKLAYN